MKFICQQHKDTIVIHESLICPFCEAIIKFAESEESFDILEKELGLIEKELERIAGEEKADEIIHNIEEEQSAKDAKDHPTIVNNDEITRLSNA